MPKLTYRDISEELGISEAAVYKHLAQGIKRIKNILIPKTMDKLTQVIDMIEHPEHYSESQIKEILQDEESPDLSHNDGDAYGF